MTIQIKRPKGELTYSCNMSRHLGAKLYGVYEVMSRLAQLSKAEKLNVNRKSGKWHRGIYDAKYHTLADALRCSISTAENYVEEMIAEGVLVELFEEQVRTERGRFGEKQYELMTHDEYAQKHKCPEHRFEYDDTGRVRKMKPEFATKRNAPPRGWLKARASETEEISF